MSRDLFACRVVATHTTSVLSGFVDSVLRGSITIVNNTISQTTVDDTRYGTVFGTSLCAANVKLYVSLASSLVVRISQDGKLNISSNSVYQHTDGRSAVLIRFQPLTISVILESLPTLLGGWATVSSNTINIVADVAADSFNTTDIASGIQCSSGFTITISAASFNFTLPVLDAAVRLESNIINVSVRREIGWANCRLAKVTLVSMPDNVVALAAFNNRFGVTLNSSTAIAGRLVAIDISGSLPASNGGGSFLVANEEVLQTANNSVFVTQVALGPVTSYDGMLSPLWLGGLVPGNGSRPNWWACDNFVEIAVSNEPTAITEITHYRSAAIFGGASNAFQATRCATATASNLRTPSSVVVSFSPTGRSSPSVESATRSTTFSATVSLSPSVESATRSTTCSKASPSNTPTPQRTCSALLPDLLNGILGVSPAPRCAVDQATYPLQALWLGTALDPATATPGSQQAVANFRTAAANGTCMPASMDVSVPFSQWSESQLLFVLDGGVAAVQKNRLPTWVFQDLLATRLAALKALTTYTVAPIYSTTTGSPIANPRSVAEVTVSANNSDSTAGIVIGVRYVGASSPQGGFAVAVQIPAELVLRCVGAELLVLRLTLQAALPLVETQSVADGVGATTSATSALTGSPGGVVRGGILSSLSGLLHCEPPDLTAEQSLLANPFNIALGQAEGQYMRGGILSSLLLLILLSALMCLLTVPLKMFSLRSEYRSHMQEADAEGLTAPTWRDAVVHTALPGMLFVPMALVGESWVANGATLVSMPNAGVGDIFLGIAAIAVFGLYVVHLLVVAWKAPVTTVALVSQSQRQGKVHKWILFWLQSPVGLLPCSEPAPTLSCPIESLSREVFAERHSFLPLQSMLRGDKGVSAKVSTIFLLRYSPYFDELNALWFKVAELVLGNVINLLGGLVTDSCFIQGFSVLTMTGVVLVLLLWKRPLAVPGQQITTTIVYMEACSWRL